MRRALRFSVLTVCLAFCLTGCSAAIGASASQSGPQRYEATWMDVFDTVTTVVGYADSEEEFEARAQEFHDEMVEYHQLYDIYNDYEGVSNIKTINDNAGVAPVEVDERIIDLLVFARDMCEATDGKTNAAMGSVTKLWHDARAAAESDANLEGTPPSEDEIAEALTHISFDTIVIDEAASTVFITDPAQSIDVGSIAKGYAVEQAASQFDDLLISAGGNVRAAGTKPDGSLWAVGVQNPDGGSEYAAVLNVTDESVVTSGDYQRYFVSDGVRCHHIIDPDTGYPAALYRSVTIVCPDSGTADALSTALFNLPVERGTEVAQAFDAQVLWIFADGSQQMTDGFAALLRD